MPGDATFERLEAVVEPYNQTHDRYQAYYRTGLSAYCSRHGMPFQETGSRFPSLLRLLGKIRASKKLNRCPGGPALMDTFARFMGAHAGRDHALGTYILHGHGETVKIVIDAFDSGELQSDQLLNWCDIYFKTNYWPTRVYPPKTLPMTNLNPDVLPHLEYLREARKAEKEWDLFAFFRIWGGVDELEGVEHNLALLETLARVKCKKFLLASLVTGDTGAAAARLKSAGIPFTTAWMPRSEVWRLAAHSRLNIVRHGMHQCIPWRMTEILAMGGCPVLDYASTTRWHVPLEEDVHYLNLGVPYRPAQAAAFDRDGVVGRVEAWLADQSRLRRIGQNTALYFDEHLTPERLGGYIVEKAKLELRQRAGHKQSILLSH